MKRYGKSVIALVSICAVIAIMLALTNSLTKGIIEENEKRAINESLRIVLPESESFEEIAYDEEKLPATVGAVYRGSSGGYVFRLNTAGYSSGMVILCGISSGGTVSGSLCLSSGETLGYEKTYGDALVGKSLSTVDGVDAISGATKTTEGYRNAVKDALSAFASLQTSEQKGGTNE